MTCGLSPGAGVAGAWVGQSLRLWDVGAGRELPAISTEYQGGTFAFSPDSEFVYVGGRGISRRGVKSGKVAYDLGAEDGYVSFSLSQDGKLLTTLTGDRVACVRDAVTGKVLRRFPVQKQGDGGYYRPEPVLSAEGAVLATQSAGALCLWDAATGKELFPADGHYGPVSAAAFSPDGRYVASAGQDGRICVWDRAGRPSPAHLTRLPLAALALAFSPRGETLRVCTPDRWQPGASVRFLDAGTGKELRKLTLDGDFDTGINAPAAFSPDGKLLAGRGLSAGRQPGLVLCSTESGKRVAWSPVGTGVDGASSWLMAVAFAPDGTLASATTDAITVWSAAERRVLRVITLRADPARDAIAFHPSGLAFSADGRLVIATDVSRRTLRVWEVESGRELAGIAGVLPSGALCAAAAPDGVTFATGQWDTTLLLWDIPTLLREPGAKTAHRPPSRERLEALWQALEDGDDTVRALRAVGELAAAPAQAVPFLAEEAEKVTPPPERLARLIADLDTAQFAAREKATRELAGIGGPAEPALREALKGVSPEASQRIERLLNGARSNNSPWSRRWSRAVQVLEYAGTPEAHTLLERIGRGPLGGRFAEQASGALARSALRPAAADRK